MRKLILIFIGIIISLPILWIFFWAIVGIPDDYYGVIEISNTPYDIIRETQSKSWLCKDLGDEQYLKVIDDCPIKDVYWNDSVLVAICTKNYKICRDTIYYMVNINSDRCKKIDKDQVSFEIERMMHIHIPYY